jgi:hypothetical protein
LQRQSQSAGGDGKAQENDRSHRAPKSCHKHYFPRLEKFCWMSM